jgi:hypothetical protein
MRLVIFAGDCPYTAFSLQRTGQTERKFSITTTLPVLTLTYRHGGFESPATVMVSTERKMQQVRWYSRTR